MYITTAKQWENFSTFTCQYSMGKSDYKQIVGTIVDQILWKSLQELNLGILSENDACYFGENLFWQFYILILNINMQ